MKIHCHFFNDISNLLKGNLFCSTGVPTLVNMTNDVYDYSLNPARLQTNCYPHDHFQQSSVSGEEKASETHIEMSSVATSSFKIHCEDEASYEITLTVHRYLPGILDFHSSFHLFFLLSRVSKSVALIFCTDQLTILKTLVGRKVYVYKVLRDMFKLHLPEEQKKKIRTHLFCGHLELKKFSLSTQHIPWCMYFYESNPMDFSL